jgi:hypothetical protein
MLALVALGLSLLLAFAAFPRPQITTRAARHAIVVPRAHPPIELPRQNAGSQTQQANLPAAPRTPVRRSGVPTLWTLLLPWAVGVDVLALVGLGVVLFVRRRGMPA